MVGVVHTEDQSGVCGWQLVVGGGSLVAFALLANLVDKMVGTRASTARLRAATKEELNTPIPNKMPDDDHEDQPEEKEQEEEGAEGEDKVTAINSFLGTKSRWPI